MSVPDQMVGAVLVYDGECPFCKAYVRMLKLREHVALQLIDARSGGASVDTTVAAGFDLDEGMVLRIGERYFHGDECIHVLAMLSTSTGTLNRMNAAIFKSRTASRLIYPILRFFRNLTLKIMGRQPLQLRG